MVGVPAHVSPSRLTKRHPSTQLAVMLAILLMTGLYLFLFNPRRSTSRSFEFVVAHYKFDPATLFKYDEIRHSAHIRYLRINWTIYNKNKDVSLSAVRGLFRPVTRSDNVSAIQLPNYGREGHTFLHHIITRYDSLAAHTMFCQENIHTDEYKAILTKMSPDLGFLGLGYEATCDCDGSNCPGPFTVEGVTELWSIVKHGESCVGKLVTPLFGCFVASRSAIRQRSKRIYETLLKIMEDGDTPTKHDDKALFNHFGPWSKSNPYIGHALERSWAMIMGCNASLCLETQPNSSVKFTVSDMSEISP